MIRAHDFHSKVRICLQYLSFLHATRADGGRKMSGALLARSWVERDLQRGDLRFLIDFAFFRNRRPPSAVRDRLCERGFLAKTARGRSRMTFEGWVAILLRHTFARRD